MSKKQGFSGSITTADGKRIPLTADQATALFEQVELEQKQRAERLPDTASCLSAMCCADSRMRELGWRNGRYCPRDGETFAVCQVGSTGMWVGYWTEDGDKKPFNTGYIMAADCVHRPSAVYFKPLDKLTEAERAHMIKCDKDVAKFIDRLGRSFAQICDSLGSEK